MDEPIRKTVCVVVLGDIGRSPRMQYHSQSLADAGYDVKVIGYKETKLNSTLTQHSNIHIHPLVPCPALPIPKLFNYVIKTIWQCFTLLCALMFKNADYVLVQNPPAVPTLFICRLYCLFTRAQFIIDWHNYANTIMALNVGENHLLVKMTKLMESYYGRRANANLCVTNAMKEDLKNVWDINAVTLYDKPPAIFHTITLEEKHKLLCRLAKQYPVLGDNNDTSKSAFTQINCDGTVELRVDRPALLISSTSWTEDEDFSVLLSALESYEESCQNGNPRKLPKLICVITGKGPLKEYYVKLIQKQAMQHVSVITPWLESADYPLLLASADLGVCLHTSSSGLDLPMKVVDMFGCCLPVCAYNFNCLYELVKHEINSYVFKDNNELTQQLLKWFDNYPNNEQQQQIERKFKTKLHKFQETRWEKNWQQHAYPLFQ